MQKNMRETEGFFEMNDKNNKTLCFTGHREIENNSPETIAHVLNQTVRILISHGARRFLTGGALGFDTMAALCVLEQKKEFPDITLELILPCKNQAKRWNDFDRSLYDSILGRADRVIYLHELYNSTCMHDRNRRLVDEGDICVAFLEHSGGGTAYTVAYALKQGKEVINIAELM